ncbi:MAG: hypothetical protein ACYDEH_12195 [Acidimicrobiales bacterium]
MALFFGGSVAVSRRRRTSRQNVPMSSIIAISGPSHVAIAGDSLWVDVLGNQIMGRSKVVKCGSRIGGIAGFTEFGACNFVNELEAALGNAANMNDVIYEFRERTELAAQRALLALRAAASTEIEQFEFGILLGERNEDGVSGISASMTVDGRHCDVAQERWIGNSSRASCHIAGIGQPLENYAEPFRTEIEAAGALSLVGACTIPLLSSIEDHEIKARSFVQTVIDNDASVVRPAWWKPDVPLVIGPVVVVSL